MKPVLQTNFGRGGNCLAACFASLLEVPLCELDFSVFDVTDRGGDWYDVALQRLQPFGVRFISMGIGRDQQGNVVLAMPQGSLFIGTGTTKRGPLLHSVLFRHEGSRMHLVHDPHPRGHGLNELREIGLLVPDVGRLDVWAQACSGFTPRDAPPELDSGR